MSSEEYCIITFKSTHQAIRSETLMKKNSLNIKIIPLPTELSAGCGLCIKLDISQIQESLKLLNENNIEFSGYYKVLKQNFKKEIEKINFIEE